MSISNGPVAYAMSEGVSESPNYKYQNERLLIRIMKEKLGITDDDMYTPDVVKQKVRDANIDEVLSL